MARRRDTKTGDLLDWQPPQVAVGYEDDVTGRGQLDNRISRLIGRALRDAREDKQSRSDIAYEMSKYLGRNISEDSLNKWASEANTNRIPLDAFVALIEVTSADELLGFVPDIFSYVVVPDRYASIIELHLIEVHEKEIAARKSQLTLKLRGVS